jgi:hypothetical protein
MTTIEEILQVMQLLPSVIAFFKSLIPVLGDKGKAQAVTLAAIQHPAISANVQKLLQAGLAEAHAVS